MTGSMGSQTLVICSAPLRTRGYGKTPKSHIHVALVPWTCGLSSEEEPRLSGSHKVGFCLVRRVS